MTETLRRSNVPDGLLATVRPRTHRLVGGVCAGIALRYGIDPLLVRAGFSLLALSGGVGIVLYAFCWVFMVEEGSSEPLIHQQVPSTRTWRWPLVVGSLVVLCIVAMSLMSNVFPYGPMPGLILLAVWWYSRRHRQRAMARAQLAPPVPMRQPMTNFDAASMAWQSRLESVYLSTEPLAPAPPQVPRLGATLDLYDDQHQEPRAVAASPAPAPRRTHRRPSWLAALVVGAFAIGAASLANQTFTSSAHPLVLPTATFIAVLGLGLLIGSFTRRPHLAVTAGVLASVLMFGSLVMPPPEHAGEPTVTYTAATQLPQTLTYGLQEHAVADFSAVPLTADKVVTIDVTYSDLTLRLPRSYEVRYDLKAASLFDHDETVSGGWVNGTLNKRVPGQPALVIVLTANASKVTLS
ncbi:PspC domain-containing protein [Propionibacteriaceae bacterium G57]|uniref:PspC domain-containing protein n=1 Tax=Aestuariimicrobium sp. G57 TaxID=3418485 RepID=UPI003DA73D00